MLFNLKIPKIKPLFLLAIIFIILIIFGIDSFVYQGLTYHNNIDLKPDNGIRVEANIGKDQNLTNPKVDSNLLASTENNLKIKIPILLYHYIGENPNPNDFVRDKLSTSAYVFEKQLNYLAKNDYTPISLDIFYKSLSNPNILPKKPIILTFDDGYIDFYYNAYPILKKYNFKAVVFVPTALIGRPAYLTWDMIKLMDKTGNITFASHGVWHKDLTALPKSKVSYELSKSKKELENQLGDNVSYLAYPYGAVNYQVVQAAKDAGYKLGFATTIGFFDKNSQLFKIPRLRPKNTVDITDLAISIMGY